MEITKHLEEKTTNIENLNKEIREIKMKLSDTYELLENERQQNSEKLKEFEENNKESKLKINNLMEEKQKLQSSNDLLNLRLKNDLDKINELNEAILKLQKEKNDYLEMIRSPNTENEESTNNEVDNLKKIFEKVFTQSILS
jgi:chromosome segregation ATPase